MNIMNEIGRLLSPNDPELVEKTLARIAEQDTWNDVFSTKLIELLDNIDSLKAEHREKLRGLQSSLDKASASLERAEGAHYKASESVLETKQILEASVAKLDQAYYFSQAAKQDLQAAEARLRSSDQCLQKARELVQESQEKYTHASNRFRAAVLYALCAVAISMSAIVWVLWVALRPDVPVWAASFASLIIVMAGTFAPRLAKI